MFNKKWMRDTAERVIATAAQALLALFLVAPQTPIIAFDWPSALALAGTAAVISLLKAIVAAFATDESVSPASLVPESKKLQ